MFDNLTFVAVIVIVSWLASFAFYLYTSRQHQRLENDMTALKKLLDEKERRE